MKVSNFPKTKNVCERAGSSVRFVRCFMTKMSLKQTCVPWMLYYMKNATSPVVYHRPYTNISTWIICSGLLHICTTKWYELNDGTWITLEHKCWPHQRALKQLKTKFIAAGERGKNTNGYRNLEFFFWVIFRVVLKWMRFTEVMLVSTLWLWIHLTTLTHDGIWPGIFTLNLSIRFPSQGIWLHSNEKLGKNPTLEYSNWFTFQREFSSI